MKHYDIQVRAGSDHPDQSLLVRNGAVYHFIHGNHRGTVAFHTDNGEQSIMIGREEFLTHEAMIRNSK